MGINIVSLDTIVSFIIVVKYVLSWRFDVYNVIILTNETSLNLTSCITKNIKYVVTVVNIDSALWMIHLT